MNDHGGTTRKCPVCGKPYKVYNMTVADQSACPKCVAEANKNYKWIPDVKTPPLNIKCLHVGQETCRCIIYGE